MQFNQHSMICDIWCDVMCRVMRCDMWCVRQCGAMWCGMWCRMCYKNEVWYVMQCKRDLVLHFREYDMWCHMICDVICVVVWYAVQWDVMWFGIRCHLWEIIWCGICDAIQACLESSVLESFLSGMSLPNCGGSIAIRKANVKRHASELSYCNKFDPNYLSKLYISYLVDICRMRREIPGCMVTAFVVELNKMLLATKLCMHAIYS